MARKKAPVPAPVVGAGVTEETIFLRRLLLVEQAEELAKLKADVRAFFVATGQGAADAYSNDL